ncbi:NUDIX hydrolase [Pararhodobacter sp. SW119]|uniref:NUDIX hydrolase n=1 Tax=Pararhodobacter sp. SW119 TaxID=2780075 RepID=UPI001ADEE284|nr:NUDIX hydrolase [Pararhodobacter sp. SW119]
MKPTALESLRALVAPVFRRPDYIQAAALCLRDSKAGRDVLMITSRGSGRWVLPKGWPMKGRTLAGAALQEAWEEAGVVGRVHEIPVGYYTYQKRHRTGLPLSCRVEVFRIDVADLARDWPEKKSRKRQWFRPDAAADLVAEADLAALLRRL